MGSCRLSRARAPRSPTPTSTGPAGVRRGPRRATRPQRSHLLGGMIEVDLPVVVGLGSAAPHRRRGPADRQPPRLPRLRTRSSGKQLDHFPAALRRDAGPPRRGRVRGPAARDPLLRQLDARVAVDVADLPRPARIRAGPRALGGRDGEARGGPEAEIAPGSEAPPEPVPGAPRVDSPRDGPRTSSRANATRSSARA